jgi:hypothetical protein
MAPSKTKPVWVLVKVQSGVPVKVEAFRNLRSARAHEDSWRRQMRPDYDESGIFKVILS